MQARFNLALQELQDMFGNLDKEVIASVLMAYQGNYEATVEALLKLSEEPIEKSSLDFDIPQILPPPVQNELVLEDDFLSLDEESPSVVPEESLSPDTYDAILAELMQSHYLSNAKQDSQEELQDRELQLAIQQSLSDMKTQPKSKKAFMQKLKDIFKRKKKTKEVSKDKDQNKKHKKASKEANKPFQPETVQYVPKFEEIKQEESVEELDGEEEEVISFVHSNGRPQGQVLMTPIEDKSLLRPK
jgi:hypothetical protein